MRKGLWIAIILCLATIWPLHPSGERLGLEPTEEWVARYNGPVNGFDHADALAIDGAGNVYVAGYSVYKRLGVQMITVKYSPAGRRIWVRQWTEDSQATDIVVDAAGNAYVTGTCYHGGTNWDFVTIKYAPSGRQLWVRKYAGPGNGRDISLDMDLDTAGNVYITGEGTNAESHATSDYTTIKYNKNGRRLWIKTYDGPAGGSDIARSIVVDEAGNAYVTGNSAGRGGNEDDFATIKYGPDGEELWVRRYDGPKHKEDLATDVAMDGSGCLFVTGRSKGPENEDDFTTLKYNSRGGLLWLRRYTRTSKSKETPMALAVDNAGHVIVTGFSGSGGFYDFRDFATVKYDADGVELWAKRYTGPVAIGEDTAEDLAVDGSGNVYITGCSRGTDTSLDFATIKYNARGGRLWVKRYNGPGNQEDKAHAIAVDSAGNVYVAGDSKGAGTFWDICVIKYRQR